MERIFKKGDIVYYPNDYSNVSIGPDMSGEEFKNLIESNFPEMQVTLEATNGWGSEEYLFAPSVQNKAKKDIVVNKGYICLKEATIEKTGLLIGIYDFVNSIYVIHKLKEK